MMGGNHYITVIKFVINLIKVYFYKKKRKKSTEFISRSEFSYNFVHVCVCLFVSLFFSVSL